MFHETMLKSFFFFFSELNLHVKKIIVKKIIVYYDNSWLLHTAKIIRENKNNKQVWMDYQQH